MVRQADAFGFQKILFAIRIDAIGNWFSHHFLWLAYVFWWSLTGSSVIHLPIITRVEAIFPQFIVDIAHLFILWNLFLHILNCEISNSFLVGHDSLSYWHTADGDFLLLHGCSILAFVMFNYVFFWCYKWCAGLLISFIFPSDNCWNFLLLN